jgi:hypothetical protein
MKKYFLFLGACILLGSCSTGGNWANAILKLGSSTQAPIFLNCRMVSGNEIEFEFSQSVKVTSINFDPVLEISLIEDGSIVRVLLKESAEPGIPVTADLLVEDAQKNTTNVLISFRARNNRMPELVINEIRTDYTRPRAEFIEFKMLSPGNLGAMRVFILGNTNATRQTIYEFLPVEVKKDEYVVLHLRKVEPDCIDEYGERLDESGGRDSSPTGRDIWIPGNAKLLHKEATAIYVLDQDDNVLTGVMISDGKSSSWDKDYLAEAAELLFKHGAFTSLDGSICSPIGAINTTGTSNTRTICRDETVENTNTAADWYITHTGCATPGAPNNPRRYVAP